MTVAEYIADQLYKKGIRYVFGIPGGSSIPYLEAFRRTGIEFILTANESAAAIMADVMARLTRIPGVCLSTLGPGATNLSTGIGEALLDRSPVIAFTAETSDRMIHRTTQMNIDHQQLMKPVTKATFRVTPGNAKTVLGHAFRICTEEYPGPVHIGLPSDIAENEISEYETSLPGEEIPLHVNNTDAVFKLLAKSKRPVLAVGLTYSRLSTREKLVSFLKNNAMPVILTPMAKGILEEDHPCYAGVLFHALSDYLEDVLRDTDLIIGLGYDPVEYNYEAWMPDVPLIHFSTVTSDLPSENEVIQITGQPEEWLSLLEDQPAQTVFNSMQIKSIRDEMISVLNGFREHFGPVTALNALMEELPPESIATFDVGSHLHLAGQLWMTGGKHNMLMTNGWSGMGFGLPAALAVSLARPGIPVVCVTGDGGFLMMAGEIITARRYNLPVIIVVLADGELNLIRLKQKWQDITPNGTKMYSGDLFDSEMFFGIRVISCDSEESLRNAVNESLTANRPLIINARIDPEDYNWLIVRKQA